MTYYREGYYDVNASACIRFLDENYVIMFAQENADLASHSDMNTDMVDRWSDSIPQGVGTSRALHVSTSLLDERLESPPTSVQTGNIVLADGMDDGLDELVHTLRRGLQNVLLDMSRTKMKVAALEKESEITREAMSLKIVEVSAMKRQVESLTSELYKLSLTKGGAGTGSLGMGEKYKVASTVPAQSPVAAEDEAHTSATAIVESVIITDSGTNLPNEELSHEDVSVTRRTSESGEDGAAANYPVRNSGRASSLSHVDMTTPDSEDIGDHPLSAGRTFVFYPRHPIRFDVPTPV